MYLVTQCHFFFCAEQFAGTLTSYTKVQACIWILIQRWDLSYSRAARISGSHAPPIGRKASFFLIQEERQSLSLLLVQHIKDLISMTIPLLHLPSFESEV